MIKHIKYWNQWRKRCLNGRVHKVLVLFGLRFSPTFYVFKLNNNMVRDYEDGISRYVRKEE